MYQENFGRNNPPQIQFNNESEYYKALGYLANNNHSTSLNWENNENQGAWGSEGRIHFYTNNPQITGSFHLTAGTGNIHHRTNCNGFTQDIQNIINTIPNEYLDDFDYGLSI